MKKHFLNSSFCSNVNLFSDNYHNQLPPYHKVRKEVDRKIIDTNFAGVKTKFDILLPERLDKTSTNFMEYIKKPE
jgi:hypothetical protein